MCASTGAQQNVSMFCCWLRYDDRKHDRKKQSVRIRWSISHTILRVCHRKSTLVCGSRSAGSMYVYCTVHIRYAQFHSRLQRNRIAGVRLRGGSLYCVPDHCVAALVLNLTDSSLFMTTHRWYGCEPTCNSCKYFKSKFYY